MPLSNVNIVFHIVNGVKVPDLRVKPELGKWYYLANPLCNSLQSSYKFNGTVADELWFERGLMYQDTEEGMQAAILHAKAMLGIV